MPEVYAYLCSANVVQQISNIEIFPAVIDKIGGVAALKPREGNII